MGSSLCKSSEHHEAKRETHAIANVDIMMAKMASYVQKNDIGSYKCIEIGGEQTLLLGSSRVYVDGTTVHAWFAIGNRLKIGIVVNESRTILHIRPVRNGRVDESLGFSVSAVIGMRWLEGENGVNSVRTRVIDKVIPYFDEITRCLHIMHYAFYQTIAWTA